MLDEITSWRAPKFVIYFWNMKTPSCFYVLTLKKELGCCMYGSCRQVLKALISDVMISWIFLMVISLIISFFSEYHICIKSIQLPVVFRASNVGLYDTQKAGFVQEFKDWSGYKTYQPRSGGGTTNTVDFFSLCLIFLSGPIFHPFLLEILILGSDCKTCICTSRAIQPDVLHAIGSRTRLQSLVDGILLCRWHQPCGIPSKGQWLVAAFPLKWWNQFQLA